MLALFFPASILQSCSSDEDVHVISAGIDYRFTLRIGETLDLKTVLKESDLKSRFRSENEKVAEYKWDTKTVYANQAGETILRSDDCTILITVTAYAGPELFPVLPLISAGASIPEVETLMEGYNQTRGYSVTFNGRNYEAVEYAPFGNSKSITFYFIDGSWYRFDFAVIDTGRDAIDNRGFLLRDFENNGSYFTQKNATSYYTWQFSAFDGSWDKIQMKLP